MWPEVSTPFSFSSDAETFTNYVPVDGNDATQHEVEEVEGDEGEGDEGDEAGASDEPQATEENDRPSHLHEVEDGDGPRTELPETQDEQRQGTRAAQSSIQSTDDSEPNASSEHIVRDRGIAPTPGNEEIASSPNAQNESKSPADNADSRDHEKTSSDGPSSISPQNAAEAVFQGK